MHLKSALLATMLTIGLAGTAGAVTINGPHSSLPCTTCHAKVAERTKAMTPNPHASHRGEADCSNCHSMHAKPRFECNDCHTFNIKMKGE